MNDFYTNTPDGMIGNDDCGQMSACYILTTLGFYQVNPSIDEFVLGAPQVKKAVIHLSRGKQFRIDANNFSTENIYSNNPVLNNRSLGKSFITYRAIMHGGNLYSVMSSQ